MSHTICYFDIEIGSSPAGRITFELFDDVVPKVGRGSVPALSPVEDCATVGYEYRKETSQLTIDIDR
jgi:hypothetical protein